MSERIIMLRSNQPMRFLVDACAALADEVNGPHAWTASDEELLAVYAETASALARLRRAQLDRRPRCGVQIAVLDHLMVRVRQTRAGEIEFRLADVVDRLHAAATSELVSF
ncbi:MAG: hypothetical protein ACLQPH_01680 [Acidimicrobiales bacterium]